MPARTKVAQEAIADPDHSSSESDAEAVVVEDGGSEDDGEDESGSGSGSAGESEEESDSDSLDSNAPRKRRRVSPQPVDDDEDDDEEDTPRVPVSFVSAPSRIKKTAAPDAQAKPQKPGNEDAPPADVLQGATSAPVDPNTSFESLGVHPWLIQSLSNMAIKRPTGIQKGCIPEILKGRDCIGGSRTGSGKTVAFAVPILQRWAEDPSAIFAVVLTPTRYVKSSALL